MISNPLRDLELWPLPEYAKEVGLRTEPAKINNECSAYYTSGKIYNAKQRATKTLHHLWSRTLLSQNSSKFLEFSPPFESNNIRAAWLWESMHDHESYFRNRALKMFCVTQYACIQRKMRINLSIELRPPLQSVYVICKTKFVDDILCIYCILGLPISACRFANATILSIDSSRGLAKQDIATNSTRVFDVFVNVFDTTLSNGHYVSAHRTNFDRQSATMPHYSSGSPDYEV